MLEEEKLSGMDNLFLQIEHPRRLMTVSSLWVFDGRLDSRIVYQSVEQLCDEFPRYASVPAHGSALYTPVWSNPIGWQPHMNIEYHRLKAPSEQSLQEYISDMQSRPFDYSKPLWELHAISGLHDEKCAFFWKAHHCLCDGLGFIDSLLEITSHEPSRQNNKASLDDGTYKKSNNRQKQQQRRNANYKKKKQLLRTAPLLNDIPDQIYFLFPAWLQWLTTWCCIWMNRVYLVWITLLHDLWVILLCILPARLSHHRDLFYTGLQSYKKQVAWSDTIRLKDIRAVRRVLGGTVNDVMVLVVTRCIKGYLEENGVRHDDFVRLFVPISQRDMDDQSFQNVVSGIWGWFSMKDLDTKELLAQVRAEMQAVKVSRIPSLMYSIFVQGILDNFPGLLTGMLPMVNRAANIPHGVFTNLPGPTDPVEFGGKTISDVYVLPPQNGKGGIAIGLVSHCDKVNITVMADAHPKYPHVARSICNRFAPEFHLLLREANMKATRR
ncbi:wax ester synthase-like acyl-CoA acyltransferase domain-containing protein [Zychaea mexicana]|uniref:wax ester synthase-like acyl-CoA acyltransferase domain-containing protein n=1 Tax=Zychaea mexicana TaxID=64656 RepID=UPI0022FF0640|nr:wax ester synthase-like acyl-CoA acyltransferase domain-containing protein [Zychaea mexicana]KAI9488743.1 wax ester synthase-like acyl-CoA acyltransferase domain-containing protein [Zychaea mexicana]